MQKKYIFLDRDGTIIRDNLYNHKLTQIEFLPKAIFGLKKLQDTGYQFIILTNQAGVAKGYYSMEDAKRFQAEVEKRLKMKGISIKKTYYCFHSIDDNCNCRKPKPGLAMEAAKTLGITLRESIFIGDKDCDIELGKNCQGKTILIKNHQYPITAKPDIVVKNLEEIHQILKKLHL